LGISNRGAERRRDLTLCKKVIVWGQTMDPITETHGDLTLKRYPVMTVDYTLGAEALWTLACGWRWKISLRDLPEIFPLEGSGQVQLEPALIGSKRFVSSPPEYPQTHLVYEAIKSLGGERPWRGAGVGAGATFGAIHPEEADRCLKVVLLGAYHPNWTRASRYAVLRNGWPNAHDTGRLDVYMHNANLGTWDDRTQFLIVRDVPAAA
jgi:hypothetical protein